RSYQGTLRELPRLSAKAAFPATAAQLSAPTRSGPSNLRLPHRTYRLHSGGDTTANRDRPIATSDPDEGCFSARTPCPGSPAEFQPDQEEDQNLPTPSRSHPR